MGELHKKREFSLRKSDVQFLEHFSVFQWNTIFSQKPCPELIYNFKKIVQMPFSHYNHNGGSAAITSISPLVILILTLREPSK